MDFEYHYTREQERFRGEVKTWFEANLPSGLEGLSEADGVDEATWERVRAFRGELGAKGWLAPTDPVEYGGGGLTSDHALVLIEELGGRGLSWLLGQGAAPLQAALRHFGTEEQKGRFLSTVAAGQATVWHPYLETGAMLDIDNVGISAFLEGDDYVLHGGGEFVGPGPRPDFVWLLAVTDPDAPEEEATAAFLVPANLPGIAITMPSGLVPGESHLVTFENVWVPAHCLLGEEGTGWSIMEATLAAAPEILIPPTPDGDVADLIKYASETNRFGQAISKRRFFQQLLMEVYVSSEVVRVFKVRNAWMASTGQELTYHHAQVELLEKKAAMRLSQVTREIMGVFAMLGPDDPLAPMQGKFQAYQRLSLVRQNPNGGLEAQAAAVVKHLGFDPLEGKGIYTVPEGAASGN